MVWICISESPSLKRKKALSEYQEADYLVEKVDIVTSSNRRGGSSWNVAIFGAVEPQFTSMQERRTQSLPSYFYKIYLDKPLFSSPEEMLKKYRPLYSKGKRIKVVYHVYRHPRQNPYIDDVFIYEANWKEKLNQAHDWNPEQIGVVTFFVVFGGLWILSLIPHKAKSSS